jgi:3-dehydroquinate dehydratase-2
MAGILLLNGPNLNLLGTREPDYYGTSTLEDINARIVALVSARGHDIKVMQSNAEHELIEAVQHAKSNEVGYIVINPGGLTHTSVTLRDALLAVEIPFIEVHLSNVHARETFRQHSYLSDIAQGVVCGLGAAGYEYAVSAAMDALERG